VKNIYYRLAISFVYTARESPNLKDVWKTVSWIILSMCMAINVQILALLGSQFTSFFDPLVKGSNFLPWRYSGLVVFALFILVPLAVLNYILVFKNGRYESLMDEHPEWKKKSWFTFYFLFCNLGYAATVIGLGIKYSS